VNIFAPDADPTASARQLADRHVVKMTLETAQIMSTVVRLHAGDDTPPRLLDGLYRATHQHHPSTVWASASRANYAWLAAHGRALGAEYTRRYDRRHRSLDIIEVCADEWMWAVPDTPATPHAQAMPDEHKGMCPHAAYRSYLAAKYAAWKRPARWTRTPLPSWFTTPHTGDTHGHAH
jgi:hypothetical protein